MSNRIRIVVRVVTTAVVLLVVVPLLVIFGALVGLDPAHWSGAKLAGADLPLRSDTAVAAPEPANIMLSQARTQDENDTGDLAPSYWDADTEQVVLGAVTDRGVTLRRTLAGSSGPPYRIDRRAHSSRELQDVQDALITTTPGAFMTGIDAEHNRVMVTVSRLGLAQLADLPGSAAVRWAPFEPLASTLEVRLSTTLEDYVPPSWWERADPIGTWFTLATGFPWYLGAGLVFAAISWILPNVRRRRPAIAPAVAASDSGSAE